MDEQQRENKGFILLTPDSRGQNLHSPRRRRKNHESQDGGRDRKPSRTAAHIYYASTRSDGRETRRPNSAHAHARLACDQMIRYSLGLCQ